MKARFSASQYFDYVREPLLRRCRDSLESEPSPRNIKILKIGDGYDIAANITNTVYMVKPMHSHINGNRACSNDETSNFRGEIHVIAM